MPTFLSRLFLIMVLTALSSNALAAPVLTTEPDGQVFMDWRVLCDNGGRCTAFTADIRRNRALLMLTREAGPRARPVLQLAVVDEDAAKGPQVRRMVDARGVVLGRFGPLHPTPGREVYDRTWHAAWTGDPVAALSAAGQRGDIVDIRASHRPPIGFSLRGLGEAAGWMDAHQGRAGGVTAMVTKGAAPSITVPLAPALPIIRQSTVLHRGALPRRSAAVDRVARDGCPDMGEPSKTVSGPFALDDRTVLWTVYCGAPGSHALNATWAPIVTDRSGRLRRAFSNDDCDLGFDYDVAGVTACSPAMENLEFDPVRGVLTGGEQAESAAWEGNFDLRVWDGRRFRTFRVLSIGLGANLQPPYQNAFAYRSVWPPSYRAIVRRARGAHGPSPDSTPVR